MCGMTEIQYTEWWWSGRFWYVLANGHSGAGVTKEQAMADARKEHEKFWRKAKLKREAYMATIASRYSSNDAAGKQE